MIIVRTMEKENAYKEERQGTSGLSRLTAAAMPMLRKILNKKGFSGIDILSYWEQIVGSELAVYTLPEKITFKHGERNNGVLQITVPNGAFALEVQHRERFILNRVNEYFGYCAVAGLKIRQGGSWMPNTLKQINQPESKKILVSEEEQNYIVEQTDGLCNEKLKNSLARLGESVLTQNRK